MVLGAVVALVARELVPGPDPGRLVVAAILGIAGASFGGFVAGVLAGPGAMGFSVWSALAAMLGAVAAGPAGGGHASFADAARAMARLKPERVAPDPARADGYDGLYRDWLELHEHFGRRTDLMKRLRRDRA